MKSGYLLCIVLSCLVVGVSGSSLSVSEIQERGKVLFRALRDSECTIKCKSRKPRIMCGSDGVSYLSKCEVKRARRCEGKNVTIKKRGKCSDSDVPMTKCFQERQEATSADSRSNAKDVFIPSCKSDGTFSEIQCHKASGYCWCVSKDGKPLSGTSTKTSTPNCRGSLNSSKVVTRQRRRNEKRKRRVNIVHSAISGCSSLKRTRFNKNIVRVFTEEYKRSAQHFPKVSKNNLDPVIDTLDKKVVEWKFSQYDKDFDNQLSRIEVKSLRRLVKKFIKPRACAKSFLKYCDSDHNKYIERGEWSLCLGVDITKDQTTEAPPELEENPTGDSITRLTKLLNPKASSSSRREEEDRPYLPPPMFPNSSNMWPGLSKTRHNPKPKPDKKLNDCRSEEQSALQRKAENPDGGIFIPKCTTDGKWQRAQCHDAVGYCWCVNESNGRPVSGTATKGKDPVCDFEAEREIQGCTYSEKQTFLSDLMTTITTELAEFAINSTQTSVLPSPDPSQSVHERAVRWKFRLLDENGNNVLEKDEWDHLKTTLKKCRRKLTRKCSRNFIRFCDENSNKLISLEEWVECAGINKSLPSDPKRTGKNPFDHFLRDT